jgi:hypothetical protein
MHARFTVDWSDAGNPRIYLDPDGKTFDDCRAEITARLLADIDLMRRKLAEVRKWRAQDHLRRKP